MNNGKPDPVISIILFILAVAVIVSYFAYLMVHPGRTF